MSEIKTGLQAVEQAVYEILGLALPGAAAVGVLACVIAPETVPPLFAAAGRHELATLALAYVSGYVVQSVSRPVTNLTRTILGAPLALARSVKALDRAASAVGGVWSRLTSGHRPYRAAHDGSTVELPDLLREQWEMRLGLAAGMHLRDCDAFDLAYSTLGAEQRRLSRLRAFVSLCRAMAAVCAVALWGLAGLLIASWPVTWTGVALAVALWLAFAAFMERADMYDALWKGIVPAQFLADGAVAATAHMPLPTAAPSVATMGAASQNDQAVARSSHLDFRDETPSPMTMIGAQGTASITGDGGAPA